VPWALILWCMLDLDVPWALIFWVSHFQVEQAVHRQGNNGGSSIRGGVGRHHGGGGQWRPALQSIAEVGT
jgi:hypothetical protein